jgi:hypothetical protein
MVGKMRLVVLAMLTVLVAGCGSGERAALRSA